VEIKATIGTAHGKTRSATVKLSSRGFRRKNMREKSLWRQEPEESKKVTDRRKGTSGRGQEKKGE